MAFMKWSEHFVTGIELVDRQHRGLVDLVNEAAPLLVGRETAGGGDIDALLERLSDYAATHFRDEEDLMAAASIDPSYLEHQSRCHHSFEDDIRLLRREMQLEGQINGQHLLRFLASWLTFHILVEDQRMARQLRLIAAGSSGADAALATREKRSDSATAVLTDALIDLLAVVSQRNRALTQTTEQLTAAQTKLTELNAALESQVDERTRELLKTNSELQREQDELHRAMETIERTQAQLLQSEKMAAIGQLAAGVAHEINNPIGFVSSNLASLKAYVDRLFAVIDAAAPVLAALAANHPARRALEGAQQTAELDFLREDIPDLIRETADGLARVRKIVADLKDFSHVDEAEWQDADLNKGLESTLNMIWSELKYKATIIRDFGDLPAVRCIPAQINQVFMNLLVNAGHAIEDKGEITITTERVGDTAVCIKVRDTGKGIAPDALPRVFEPFYTTKPVGKGTGLGLSLAWNIVERHRGRIEVASEEGQGTTFTVTLPIEAKSAGEGESRA